MKAVPLARLKLFSLTFLLPGLLGLIISTMISSHYLDTLPKWPAPDQMRTTPRNIHGSIVYQTAKENRDLSIIEYSSIGVFMLGLGLGLVYLERWGNAQEWQPEEDEDLVEKLG